MVSTQIKLTVMLLMMNIVIYLGLNLAVTAEGDRLVEEDTIFRIEGDLMESILRDSLDQVIISTRENFTDYNINLTNDFTTFPDLTGGEETGTGGISFLDSLRIASAFAKTMFNIAVSPLTLFTSSRVPALFSVIIGIPYFIVLVITVIAFMRGVSD